jgi:hypothetical protein
MVKRLILALAVLASPSLAHAQFATIKCWNGTTSFPCGDLVSTSLRVKIIEAPTLTISGTVTVTDGAGALNTIVDSSALPSGAATSALQSTIVGHVDGLEALLGGTLTVGTHAVTQSGTWTVTANTERAASASNDGSCVSVTTSSTALLASNASRKGFTLYSRETNTALVSVKFAATATTSDFPMPAGAAFNMLAGVVYTGAIDAISASGTQSVCVVEF